MRLDRYDMQILQILHQQGRITKSGLAEAINLSISPCWERVKRLEAAGIIEGYGARVNTDKLLKRSPVLVEISLRQHNAEAFQRFEKAALKHDEIVECYATGGGVDYIIKVMSESIEQYQAFIDRCLESDMGIERYFTYIVTKTVKQQATQTLEFKAES